MARDTDTTRSEPVAGEPPLYVDLDGTLVKTDLVLEALLALMRQRPWLILALPYWWWCGRAQLKYQLARRVPLDPARLPYSQSFLAYLAKARAAGRSLVLATGAPADYADAVAAHVGLFDAVLASTERTNLTGRAKLARIRAETASGGFDYAGNSAVDLPLWHAARRAIVVNAPASVRRRLRNGAVVAAEFDDRLGSGSSILKALRPHQWLKNLLLLVPAAAGHRLLEPTVLSATLIGIVGFSAAASAGYVFNDVLDAPADRLHPRKRRRPFAAGDLPPQAALVLIPLLLLAAAATCLALPLAFGLVLLGYLMVNTAYSLVLKRQVLIDVFVLAGLYAIRMFAGGAASGVAVSSWLLAFALFLFFSLALVKRFAELQVVAAGAGGQPAGRGYRSADAPFVLAAGLASGYLAVVVLALYLNSAAMQTLYHRPALLWGLCMIVLYWISRVWLVTVRGEMHDDPVVYALTDRVSLIAGGCAAVLLWLAA